MYKQTITAILATAFLAAFAHAAEIETAEPETSATTDQETMTTASPTSLEATGTTIQMPTPAKEQPARKGYQIEAQIITSSYTYKEDRMKLSGIHYGASATARFATPALWRSYVGFSGEFLTGQPEYDGQTVSGVATKADTQDDISTFTAFWGRIFRADGYSTRYDVRLGLGYRYLNNEIEDTRNPFTLSIPGYEREQEYLYSPIVLTVIQPINSNWSLRMGGEFDYLWQGENTSHFEDMNPTNSTFKFKQDSGFGYKLSAGPVYRVGQVRIVSEVFYRVWDIDDSDYATGTINGLFGRTREPENKTSMTGLGVGASF